MSEPEPDIIFPYAQPGCVEGCCYRLPDTQKLVTREHQNYLTYHRPPKYGTYTVLEITPHCTRESERAAFRAQIYERAWAESDAAADRCKTIRGKVRAQKRAWEEVTAPWVKGPCPFFKPSE